MGQLFSKDLLQNVGFVVLAFFFYMYTLGNLYGSEDAYLSYFFVAIIIAAILFFKDTTLLKQFPRYYIWQAAIICLMAFSILYTVQPKPIPYVIVMFKILLKVTTVAIICQNFDGVKKLLLCYAFVGVAVFVTLYVRGLLDIVGRLGNDIMGNANSFGLMTTVFYIGAISSIDNVKKKPLKWFLIIAVILDIYMMILTGGRKFLLFAAVYFFSTMLARGAIKPSRFIVVGIITAIIVVFVGRLIMTNSTLYDAIGYRFDGLGQGQAEGVDDQEYIMKKGIELFLERPILGWGVEGFKVASRIGLYAHSNYVELLADYGIVGFLLYYSNLIWCTMIMWRNRKSQDEEFNFYFPLLVSVYILEFFHITFNQTAYIPLFVMLISGYCFRLKQRGMHMSSSK